MKKLFFIFFVLPFINYSQNYLQQNFLLPLEITGTQLIQEGVDFTVPDNTILHMLDRFGSIQYITNNYQGIDCPCIIGPGNTVAHSNNNDGIQGILYAFNENSYVKPITINSQGGGILGLFQKINFGMSCTLIGILKGLKEEIFYLLEKKSVQMSLIIIFWLLSTIFWLTTLPYQ